jgi:hypothetical protein
MKKFIYDVLCNLIAAYAADAIACIVEIVKHLLG